MREVSERPRIAVLASGSGTTAESLVRASLATVDFEVAAIVCNMPAEKAGVYDRVDKLNREYGLRIPVHKINGVTHPGGNAGKGRQTDEESAAIAHLMHEEGIDHVALAGYMKIVRGGLLYEYGYRPDHRSNRAARMTNTHPGPLSATEGLFGVHCAEKVLELGLTASAHTVHLVAEKVDEGPIIAVHPVAFEPGDSAETIFRLTQATEKGALAYTLEKYLNAQREHNGSSRNPGYNTTRTRRPGGRCTF